MPSTDRRRRSACHVSANRLNRSNWSPSLLCQGAPRPASIDLHCILPSFRSPRYPNNLAVSLEFRINDPRDSDLLAILVCVVVGVGTARVPLSSNDR